MLAPTFRCAPSFLSCTIDMGWGNERSHRGGCINPKTSHLIMAKPCGAVLLVCVKVFASALAHSPQLYLIAVDMSVGTSNSLDCSQGGRKQPRRTMEMNICFCIHSFPIIHPPSIPPPSVWAISASSNLKWLQRADMIYGDGVASWFTSGFRP